MHKQYCMGTVLYRGDGMKKQLNLTRNCNEIFEDDFIRQCENHMLR